MVDVVVVTIIIITIHIDIITAIVVERYGVTLCYVVIARVDTDAAAHVVIALHFRISVIKVFVILTALV